MSRNLFRAYCRKNDNAEPPVVSTQTLLLAFEASGILHDDKRLAKFFAALKKAPPELTESQFESLLEISPTLVEQVLTKHLAIPQFQEFCSQTSDIFAEVEENHGGQLANYIPQLEKVDPEKFAVSVCTVDGQRFNLGDAEDYFCVQSCSKPITYCLALEARGEEEVHKYVGAEPSGKTFNELTLNSKSQPHNPMINAGAIMCGALLKSETLDASARFDYVMKQWTECAGQEKVGFDNAVYLSERQTADRNFALAYFMREKKAFPAGVDLLDALEFYFQCCSIEITTRAMSIVAATLANGGNCPLTGQQVFKPNHVKNCLSLMSSCGMYDFSGEFAFRVGIPAKSGVSGAIMLVVPNVAGFAIWSPRLDELGNSVRGVHFCRKLVENFKFHTFDSTLGLLDQRIDPRRNLYESRLSGVVAFCFAAAEGDVGEMRRLVAKGVNPDQSDYDGRTALHLAASEGKLEAVRYLLDLKVDKACLDRWGNTPLDDARRQGHKEVAALLSQS